MESLYLLIPVAVVFVGMALGAFLWAVNRDQFDDLEKEAHRILFDDEGPGDNRPQATTRPKK